MGLLNLPWLKKAGEYQAGPSLVCIALAWRGAPLQPHALVPCLFVHSAECIHQSLYEKYFQSRVDHSDQLPIDAIIHLTLYPTKSAFQRC